MTCVISVTILLYLHQERITAELRFSLQSRPPSPPRLVWRQSERAAHLLSGLPPPQPDGEAGTGGCSLTHLDPFSPDILALVSHTPSVQCRSHQPSLLYTTRDSLHLNTSTGYTFSTVTCSFRYIYLRDSDTYSFSPEQVMTDSPTLLSNKSNSVWARSE